MERQLKKDILKTWGDGPPPRGGKYVRIVVQHDNVRKAYLCSVTCYEVISPPNPERPHLGYQVRTTISPGSGLFVIEQAPRFNAKKLAELFAGIEENPLFKKAITEVQL